jgi:aspartate 1-decarboxylase
MLRTLLKSKIHRVTVTEADLDYEGSLTLDRNLMDIADLLPYEEVHIFNVTNGHRFSTYVIEGKRGSNVICVNGAAAHLAREGDCLIIANFSVYSEQECKKHFPRLIYVDESNKVVSVKPDDIKLKLAEN